MAANAKQGGKNRKYGRHGRSTSDKAQKARTDRNKAKAVALEAAKGNKWDGSYEPATKIRNGLPRPITFAPERYRGMFKIQARATLD